MGRLVDRTVPSLFNGVSRQPDLVRLPSQVAEGEDAMFSVVTGGFEKRPATKLIGVGSLGLDTTKKWHIHWYDRDELEQYAICVGQDGSVRVFLLVDGSEAVVNSYSAAIQTYLSAPDPINDLAVVTIEDFTFIVNRTVEAARKSLSFGTLRGTVQSFADLPGGAAEGDIYKVAGGATKFDDFYVRRNAAEGVWEETSDPSQDNGIDETTMPHALVRQPDGTFTAQTIDWKPRRVGDDDTVPMPPFIGEAIQDIYTHKSRLGIVAKDVAVLSETGDLFDFFPREASNQVDTDPVDRRASSTKPTTLRWVVPIRGTLWMTSETAQYELTSSNALTPRDASVDLTTGYRASRKARPVLMGDELYFVSTTDNKAQVWEVLFEDDSALNSANEVTKHVGDYIPAEVQMLVADPAESTLYAYATGAPGSFYVYRTFWEGDEKVQSAWARWNTGADEIYGMGMIQGRLYLLTRRGTGTFLELTGAARAPAEAGLPFSPLLNIRTKASGTYSAVTLKTSWTLPFGHDGRAQIVLPADFTAQKGKTLSNLEYDVDGVTIRAAGDFSAAQVFVGLPYEMDVELSKQQLKDEEGASIIEGRLQLRRMSLAYSDTTVFTVKKTPKARTTRTYTMTGRILGDISNMVGEIPVSNGTFSFPVKSNAKTVEIRITNDTPYPSVIASASWIGFFNETSRQDAAR